MPVPIETIPFIGRRRRRRTAAAAAPAALTLVSAAYDGVNGRLTLTFDRAVDVAGGVDGTQIVVDDAADTGRRYDASGGASVLGPAVVRFTLNDLAPSTGTGTTLDASAATGIVAAAPPVGGTWAGASGLALPWP